MVRSDYRFEIDADLEYRYNKLKQTIEEIADYWRCSTGTIFVHMRMLGIKSRPKTKLRSNRICLKMTQTDMSYLAGILDGEGTIALTKRPNRANSYSPYLVVVNTSKALMDWIVEHTGLNCVYISKDSSKNNIKYKKLYKWEIKRVVEIYDLLKIVYPYLVIKKANAENVLSYCEQMIKTIPGSIGVKLPAEEVE